MKSDALSPVETAIRYFERVITSGHAEEMCSGRLKILNEAKSVSMCSQTVTEYWYSKRRIGRVRVDGSRASIGMNLKIGFRVRVPTTPRFQRLAGQVDPVEQVGSRTYRGPVQLVNQNGTWLVKDYRLGRRWMSESIFNDLSTTVRADGLEIRPHVVELRDRGILVFADVVNQHSHAVELASAILKQGWLRTLGWICSGVEIPPNAMLRVDIAWKTRPSPRKHSLEFIVPYDEETEAPKKASLVVRFRDAM